MSITTNDFVKKRKNESAHKKTQQNAMCGQRRLDQSGYLPSLIRVFAVHSIDS